MNFAFTEEQNALNEAIHKFLMVEAAPEWLREVWETRSGRSTALRAKLAEQGLTAFGGPGGQGGLGLGDVVWVRVLGTLGYFAIPDSLPDTAYVAASLLRALPESEARTHWLTEIAAGRARVALAHQSNPCVADAEAADLLLVERDGAVIAYSQGQVALRYNRSIDASRRMYQLDTQGHAGQCLQADGAALWAATYDRASLSVAAQHLGLAARMLDLAVDYSAQRKQFGKPIGSFQAVKHHLADVAVKLEFARPVLYRAAYALQHGEPQAAALVSHARLAASEAAMLAARKGIQVHGAMGYTWEADLQMFMKRAWALDHSWGSRGAHEARVAAHVLAASTRLGPSSSFA